MEILNSMLLAAGGFSAALGMIENVLSVAFGLGLVVFFHELGHFAVAKWCNVHVERFSIGIGPILWSRQKGETEYALSLLPLGGYVKMLGQDDMDPNQMTSSEIAENPRAYSSKTVLQRMAIISAGVVMNVITGFLFFVIAYSAGLLEPAPVVGAVSTGYPAWNAGIRPGDTIETINGEQVRTFIDIQEAIVLSSDELQIGLKRGDGTEETLSVLPARGGLGRSIGIGFAMTTRLSPSIEDPELISDAGLPCDRASELFQPGDNIVGIRPASAAAPATPSPADADQGNDAGATAATPETATEEPVIRTRLLSDLRLAIAQYADREVTCIVERTARSGDSEADSQPRTIEIRIPSQNIRSLGFWMAMGPVRSIRSDSIAAKAGLKVGDTIQSVDGQVPGEDIDPLFLPVYFAQKAGQPVKVVVARTSSDGPSTAELTLVPSNLPGWSESVDSPLTPLTIPSIGAGYQVQTRIARILPGSEAEKLGTLTPSSRITRIELLHPDPGKGQPDALGDDERPVEIKLDEAAKGDGGKTSESADINWAWGFETLQRVPGRRIVLHFESPDGKQQSVTLKEFEKEPNWFLWIRGFNAGAWVPLENLQKAESIGKAIQLGYARTRRNISNIYLSLRQLIRREVSAESLSGPVGIFRVSYHLAEQGIFQLISFLGLLSINLAVLNFLPIPILDGGHMVFLIWEGITRRKPSAKVVGWAHAVGLLLLLSLFSFVLWNDLFFSP
ncbi:MAG: RIP metalloprotease RseP [Planctomycetaceae bacterium]